MQFRLFPLVELWVRRMVGDPTRRFQLALSALLLLIVAGTAGYLALLDISVIDAVYQVITTVATVGFGEVVPFTPAARVFTIALIILGVGVAAWAATTAVEVALGQHFWSSIRTRRMEERLRMITDHYIICGYGRMGRQIARDLRARQETFVVVERERAHLDELVEFGIPFVEGDATQDDVLLRAGIERARGVVAAMGDDAANVVAVLTARGLSPGVKIVARATTEVTESKLRRAGADRVVSPYAIGGHRLALALLQPSVDDFMNHLFNVELFDVDIGAILVKEQSEFAGQTIAGADLRNQWHLTVIAVRDVAGDFTFSPPADHLIRPGESLIVLGPPEALFKMQSEA